MTQATNTQAQAQAQTAQAFNLVIEGVGYLNRVRFVEPKKGPVYLACTVNALMGTSDAVEYLSIDCRVVGKLAQEIVQQLKDDVNAQTRVLINFRAGDPKPEWYEVRDGKTGQMVRREGLKARLLQITSAKVDGVKIDIALVQRQSEPRSSEALGADNDVGSPEDRVLAEV